MVENSNDYGDDDDDDDGDDDGDQVWSGGAVAGCHGKSPTSPCTASTGDQDDDEDEDEDDKGG